MTVLDEDSVRAIIREKSDRFEDAFRHGDMHRLVEDYYVDDAQSPILSAPDGPMIVGRDAIEVAFGALGASFSDCKLEQVRVDVAADMAHELGRCDLTTTGGEAVTARYSILWKRLGEDWRVSTDFFALGDLQ